MEIAHNYKMGKKTNYCLRNKSRKSKASAFKKSPERARVEKNSYLSAQQTSPKSKTQDTAIYYEDSEEPPAAELKDYEIQKTEALHLLSGLEYPTHFGSRAQELYQIDLFIKECIKKERKGCRFLMITGAPGLGKTLTVTTAL